MMHPTLAVALALLTWLLVRNRSIATRLLLGVAALLLGWEPASTGSASGGFLLTVAAGIALSLAWDGWARSRSRDRFVYRIQDPGPTASTQNESRPAEPPVSSEPMTELDRAETYGELLDAYFAGLQEAQESGDVRAQAAFAGEIADIAKEMRSLLRVVVGDRQRLVG